ncbi:thiamine pyrophosphate-binding protein [Jannaschia ovalis]|uniref:Thiamine pyrophosphate-binding protein n=1 Tax=Jannaschia ovalis TaxID=3038773 RepID=A0ABY8L7E8_9RHOB|nr:thiamine pyrophosphate-binding protein [Jannaschia sp. GRR-S6-38]WGH77304.1 thiamine pyrophosphate-binding protein [Jannaschia sp. GRR-S6-38]
MRGADLLIATLKAAGVTRIYSLSGNQIMPVYDACLTAGIRIVHTRHEGAAVFMAEAHAQMTGEVGVALVTAGCGLANALGPLLTARESDSPVLLLSGDSPVAQDGRGAFQEMDQTGMTRPLTKLSLRPRKPADLGPATARALRVAMSGRPGPVHVALAFDAVEGDAGDAPVPLAPRRDRMAMAGGEAARIAEAMARAARPLILLGPVVSPTREPGLSDALVDALDAPSILMESPRGLRDPALGQAGAALREADVVLCLGKRVDFTLGFGAPFRDDAQVFLVTPDPAERDRAHLNLGTKLAATSTADPRDAAEALIGAAQGGDRDAWRARVTDLLDAPPPEPDATDGISPAQIGAAVQRKLDADPRSVVICDGGEFGQWAQATTRAARRITNGISGAIGGGPCYALAAKMADPEAPVIALVGDGTVGFHFAEFETAAREGVAFVVVVGNDRCWNAEAQIQIRDYGADRQIGCDLSGARYDAAVAALGGHGEYVTEAAGLDAALDRALASGKPALVNVAMKGAAAPAGH